jgi:hypothetical protein
MPRPLLERFCFAQISSAFAKQSRIVKSSALSSRERQAKSAPKRKNGLRAAVRMKVNEEIPTLQGVKQLVQYRFILRHSPYTLPRRIPAPPIPLRQGHGHYQVQATICSSVRVERNNTTQTAAHIISLSRRSLSLWPHNPCSTSRCACSRMSNVCLPPAWR